MADFCRAAGRSPVEATIDNNSGSDTGPQSQSYKVLRTSGSPIVILTKRSKIAIVIEKLDFASQLDGKRYYLTIAGAATPSYITRYTEMGHLHQYLDWINVMAYDLHGSWDKRTDFHAALLCNGDASGQDKIFGADGIRLCLEAGVPPDKLHLGVPFYGHIYTGVGPDNNGLYQPFGSCATIPAVEAAALYGNAPGFTRYWHNETMAAWLFDGATFIDCEDAESLRQKAKYVKEKGLGGMMIWEISHDPNGVLLEAMVEGLR